MFYWRINQIAISAFFLSVFLFGFLSENIEAQTSDPQYDSKSNPKANRVRGLDILQQIKEVVREKYYDPNYRGINLDQRFKAAEEQIKGQDKNWQIYRTIAQVLIDFNDSHTKFFPPDRLYRVEYGYSAMMIGNKCFVVEVKKGSDAEVKGLRAGAEIVSIKGFPVARENMWVINYIIYSLDPQETISLVLSDNNKQHEITFQSKFISPEERNKQRQKRKAALQEKPYTCQKISMETIACKLRTFEVEKEVIDKMMKEAGAHKKMILDLRGNGGGYVETEMYITGYFFEQDVKIGDEKGRTKTKERIAKSRKEKSYKGDLVVLIDSESASASEIFARTIQIEKRGKIIGDTSAGMVMTSQSFGLATSLYKINMANQPYQISGISISVGDLIMKDGNRLESIGVSPDFPVGPSSLALAIKSDPVLAFAAERLGSPISAEKAGEFYFFIPKTEDIIDNEGDDEKKE